LVKKGEVYDEAAFADIE